MKRVIGIILVLILAITLGLAADGFREGGVSMANTAAVGDGSSVNTAHPIGSSALTAGVYRAD